MHSLVLFDPWIRAYQMLPLHARMDLGVMAIKRYSAFSKAPALLEPHHQIPQCHKQDTCWLGVLPLWREPVSIFYSSRWLGNHILSFNVRDYGDKYENIIMISIINESYWLHRVPGLFFTLHLKLSSSLLLAGPLDCLLVGQLEWVNN